MRNAAGSVQDKLRSDHPALHFLSIGQRDANYPSRKSLQVQELALAHQLDEVVIKNPKFAVARSDGSAVYPAPPDYWIAAYSAADSHTIPGCIPNK